MKKWLGTFVLIFTLLLMSACSSEGSSSNDEQDEIKPVVKDEADSTVEPNEEDKEETEATVTPVKTEITKDEFNQKFKLDPEEEQQYKNGKFELADGSTVNADYLFYVGGETFTYAMAIFFEGKLADIQFETDKSQEEVAEALGISFENATVEENNYGFEVNFDEQFHDSNISVYPNEWD
jgi:5'-3' exonuclease